MFRVNQDNSENSRIRNALFTIFSLFFSLIISVAIILNIDVYFRMIFLIGFTLVLVIVYVFTRVLLNRSSDYNEYRKNRIYYDNLNFSFYTKEFNKEIIIHDTNGTASFIIHYKLKNISKRPFKSLVKTIDYDGDFVFEDFLLKVDDAEYNWNSLNKVLGKKIEPKNMGDEYQKQLVINIPLKNYINPNDTIYIFLKYKLTKVFQSAFKEGKEEWSSIKIAYPIDKFKLKITFDMKERHFIIYKKIDVMIETILTKDSWEEYRITQDSNLLPQGNQTNKLTWECENPKVGNIYSLYFRCEKV